MATKKKLLQAAAGQAGGAAALNVEDVFSTYLFTPNTSGNFSVTNNIDLDGEGGLVWLKQRDVSANHLLYDTNRGASAGRLASNLTNSEALAGVYFDAFNSDGFTVKDMNNDEMASWTFRKAPKFFDVVTYTGDGVAGKTISHNLGTTVGSIFVKRTSGADNWTVYHRGVDATAPEDYTMYLNTTEARANQDLFFDTAPTDSVFYLGDNIKVNGNGSTYVAYLFAHNDGDGDFGPDGDADIIKCGSFTDSPSGGVVDLGWEPQWVLVKNADYSGSWVILDSMRGYTVSGVVDNYLFPNSSGAEATYDFGAITSTGFTYKNDAIGENIYIAIRRGTKVPESADEVFAIDNQTASSAPFLTSDFPVDMAIRKKTTGSNSEVMSRLTQGKVLFANATSSEQTDSVAQFDFNDGCLDNTGTDAARYGWMWKRAPGYFDAVAYTGNGTAGRTVSHNLGVAPEMMWVKSRGNSEDWYVYHKDLGNGSMIILNKTSSVFNGMSNVWNNTSPTSSVFTVGTNGKVNLSGDDFITYLFASRPGISKVGSYTGTGSALNIDCGFTSGARFVLLKRTDSAQEWRVFDTARGIVAGNDPLLNLNSTGAEEAFDDLIDPYSAGFSLTSSGMVNASGASYIFYAIA